MVAVALKWLALPGLGSTPSSLGKTSPIDLGCTEEATQENLKAEFQARVL